MSVVTGKNNEFQDAASSQSFLFVSHASADNPRLKPVVQALLDAGLPLWFDKPGDLEMSISDFAGHIPIGESWSEELIDRMRSAHAMVYFPTENYEMSRECRFEHAQAFVHRSASRHQFKIIALVLSEADFRSFDPRQGAIQGAKTIVKKRKNEWVLDQKRQADFNNLVIELRALLNKPSPFSFDEESTNKDAVREYTIPYRINRDDEKEQVRDAYSYVLEKYSNQLRDPNRLARRPLIICHGESHDEHKRFTSTSLNATLVQSTPRLFKSGAASEKPIRPKWPSTRGIKRRDDFIRRYRDTVFDKLKNKVSELPQTRGSDEQAAIAKAICDEETTRIISTRLNVHTETPDSFKELQAHIESWVQFWDDFPFCLADGDAHFHLIPVLEVVYGETKPTGFLRRKSLSQSVQEYLNKGTTAAALSKACRQVSVEVLPEFQTISKSTVHDWIDFDELIFGEFSEAHCRTIEQDIYAGGVLRRHQQSQHARLGRESRTGVEKKIQSRIVRGIGDTHGLLSRKRGGACRCPVDQPDTHGRRAGQPTRPRPVPSSENRRDRQG